MQPRSLSSLVAGFKSTVTHPINKLRPTPRVPVWQRNDYEHIVREGERRDRQPKLSRATVAAIAQQ